MTLVIIADDFTGALDTGIQLAKHGIKTVVTSLPEDKPEDCEALAYNLDFRHLAAAEVYELVYKTVSAWQGENVRFYLKTDSALRGRLSAAFAAASDATGMPVMFVPAFPQAGRTTREGGHYIDGVPLERTSFAEDPRNPITKSYIPDILREDMPLSAEVVTERMLETWEYNPDKSQVSIFDCTDSESLERIGAVLKERQALALTAGCAGFASVFHQIMELRGGAGRGPRVGNPMLVISGSVNERSFAQIAAAIEAGYPFLHLSPRLILDDDTALEDELVARAVSLLQSAKTVIAAVGRSGEDRRRMDCQAQSLGITGDALHERILSALTRFTGRVTRELSPTLLVFGGDTGFDLLKSFGTPRVEPLCEVEPGVPVSSVCWDGREITLITKSGGLGSVEVIARAEKFLRENLSDGGKP